MSKKPNGDRLPTPSTPSAHDLSTTRLDPYAPVGEIGIANARVVDDPAGSAPPPTDAWSNPVEAMHDSVRGPAFVEPGPAPDLSWDEAESAMRQLEKELQVAKGAHAALRKAREAGEAVTKAEQEHARLTAEIETLRTTLDEAREQATRERESLASDHAAREVEHAQSVAAMTQEIDDLTGRVAIARQAAEDADVTMQREHDDAVALRRSQIDTVEQEKARVETALRELKAQVAGLG